MRKLRSLDVASLFAAPPRRRAPTALAPVPRKLILSGHSSGANITALALLAACADGHRLCDAYVSLSGVFDVCKHYEFERSRGVHVVSPMGAAAGKDESRFWESSPTLVLQQLPLPRGHVASFFPPCLFLHGTMDTTVPMTSSMEMASELSKHGVQVHTAFPAVDHVQPMLELLEDPTDGPASPAAGGVGIGIGTGPVRAALRRWYAAAMEPPLSYTGLRSNL